MIERSKTYIELAKKKLKIQKVIESAGKTTENDCFKSKYADLHEVIETIKAAMDKAKVLLLIEQYAHTDYSNIMKKPIDIRDRNGDIIKSVEVIVPHVLVSTIITDVESGEFERYDLGAFPAEDTPQAIGSTITYLRRYAIMPAFGVTPFDDDGNMASGRRNDDKLPLKSTREDPLKSESKQSSSSNGGSINAVIDSDQYDGIVQKLEKIGVAKNVWKAWLKRRYNIATTSSLTVKQYTEVMAVLVSRPNEVKEFKTEAKENPNE